MTRRRGRWLRATAAAAVALGSNPAVGAAVEAGHATAGDDSPDRYAPPVVPILKPEEEMILQVRTDKWILDDSFSGYSTPTGTYLPLGAFTRMLDLAVAVDGDAGKAEGWALNEKNVFRIDVNAGFVETKDGRKPLRPGDAFAQLGEIYVRPALLADWFPIQADVSLPKQEVDLKLLATFPFEAKMERETKRDMLGVHPAAMHIEYPRERTIYEMLSAPALDVNLQAKTGNQEQTTSQYDIRASGDLGFMNADLFLSGQRGKPLSDARFTVRRRDPDGKLPGGLTLIELGDTSTVAQSIGVRSRTGRGVVIGNQPIDEGSVFDKIDLRGELPIGYEVELYRNDVLIGSVNEGVNGRYEFPQVPLEYGLNLLRLVFYGPHGERREEIRQINAGQDRLSKGEFHFAASAVQQDDNLIPIKPTGDVTPLIDKGAIRAVAGAEYGLSTGITAVGGLASFVVGGSRVNQGMAGIRTDFGGAAIQLDAATQSHGAYALQLGLAGRLAGTSYVLQHSQYGGNFIDELRGDEKGTYKSFTQLRLDRGFRLGSRMIATNLVAERSRHDGATELDATFRASTSFSRWLISNQLEYRSFDGASTSTSDLQGSFEVNGILDEWGIRGGIGYDLKSGEMLREIDLAIDHDLGAGAVLRGTVTHQLADARATRVGLSLSRHFGPFDSGGEIDYDTSTRSFVVGIRTSFSFGRGLRGWRVAPPGLARGGSMLALAFRDANGDGKRERDEPAIQGVGFRGGAGEVKTNAQGLAMISDLGDGRPARVTMLADTLPDPYMAPTRAGVEIVPRPGRTHLAEFPVAMVSEMEGHAYFRSTGGKRAVSNVQLQLVDSKGNIIALAKTEYDGYFFLERVPPGKYLLRIEPDQASKLGIMLDQPVPVKAGADGGLVSNVDLLIVRAPTMAAKAQAPQGQ